MGPRKVATSQLQNGLVFGFWVTKKTFDEAQITEQLAALADAADHAVYNTTKFTLRDMNSRGSQQQLLADFEDYPNGFSPKVLGILEKFQDSQLAIRVDEPLFGQCHFSPCVSLTCLRQNPEILDLSLIPHNLPVNLTPHPVPLPDDVSSSQFIGFIEQA